MMELGAFPDELRKQAIEIGQVLKMEMFPSRKGLSSSDIQMTVVCWPLFW